MPALAAAALLDIPPFPPSRMAELADRLAAILNTKNDVLIVQGEAILALEAVATSLPRRGMRALNIVTSPYGDWFGRWLCRAGAEVTDLRASGGQPIEAPAVEAELAKGGYDLVALVHAESSSGILNPLEPIARAAGAAGALVIVDAVASVGGHELDVDALGIDIAVIGAQKSLGGSAGLSALSVSPAAWERLLAPGAPELSSLSLLDLKHNWLDKGRGALPGMPSALELHALDAALDRVEREGLAAVIARHARAAEATRAGLVALGLTAFVSPDRASNLTTAAVPPPGIGIGNLLSALAPFDTGIGPGIGEAAERLVRLNHTSPRAALQPVLTGVLAVGQALASLGCSVDLGAAAAVILSHYDGRAR
ncbi:aminotransferase class V-fold PLP-dependent enzyme [Devosia enhydra]|uniref:pyridoxal-phosphate-dependent aminotransferase family protein n=1 Tax=Devosia enhydra TaxID=665118 RepID=UPI000931F24F